MEWMIIDTTVGLTEVPTLPLCSAESLQEISVRDSIPDSRSRTALILAPADSQFGMRNYGRTFRWNLNDWQALRIAERIELLTPKEIKSGSDIFEVGNDGEIPVKITLGEFTDDFLVSTR